MWFDGIRQPNTIYVANSSRGKDSTAMLRAIQLMGWPLDMIVSVDIWFDEETPAELPPMVKFKDEYDQKVLDWFGIPVTRLCAEKRSQIVQVERERESGITGNPKQTRNHTHDSHTAICSITKRCEENIPGQSKGFQKLAGRGANTSRQTKLTYTDIFYRNWCLTLLKEAPLTKPLNEGQKINIVHYIGIAADEPLRIAKHMDKKDKVLPLVQIGWDEDLCGLEATYMEMLSPTYSDGQLRDGCWFCHNQGVNQLRRLRKNYPDLWEKLMKLDNDSPVSFHPDGHTVHDFDERFQAEDDGYIKPEERFLWSMLDALQLRWF